MKNKVITFLAAIGIPISALWNRGSCTGACGSCQLGCLPVVLAVVILSFKIIRKKIKDKRRIGYE